MANMISPRAPEDSGNARANIPDVSEERDNRGTSGYSRILFKRFPGTQSVRRVASGNRFKTTERTHLRTSLSYAHYKFSDYAFKIDLQDAYFHVLIHPDSRKYLRFAFENKVYQFRVLPFGLNTTPQIFTLLGQTVAAYLYRQGISVIPYLDNWFIQHPEYQAILCHQSQLLKTIDFLGLKLKEGQSELDPVQDIQFLGL